MKFGSMIFKASFGIFLSCCALFQVNATEYKVEPLKNINGMEIQVVYLQPILMNHDHENDPNPDIHIEADIKASADNKQSLAKDSWIPYLNISYTITKKSSFTKEGLQKNNKVVSHGKFVPMIANDGPHYGKNVALDGPGEYEVTLQISPPDENQFFYHTDKETGLNGWWKPFESSWNFTYTGTGKKGGY